jgi:diguanylate cyclase (GGDEF)-like protein
MPARPASPDASLLASLGLGGEKLSARAKEVLSKLVAERDALIAQLAEAEAAADRDSLTSCFSRGAFMRELHRAMSAVERYNTPAAVLFIDLDGFKSVNDNFGHGTGDAVLRHIGRLLMTNVRESDVVGRIGGDEFGVILNHASASEAQAKAEFLEAALRINPAQHAGKTHRVNASFGVNAIAKPEDPEIALARADEAMYADKNRRKREAAWPEF